VQETARSFMTATWLEYSMYDQNLVAFT